MLLTDTQRSEFRKVRDALMSFYFTDGNADESWLSPSLIDRFVGENPASLSEAELAAVAQWRTAVEGPFFVMRHTPSCTIFMNGLGTFAVRGTDRELSQLVPKTPTRVDVTLLAFDGLIVCATNPTFAEDELGEASRADIDATYRSLADKGVIYSAAAMARALRHAGGEGPRRRERSRPVVERAAEGPEPKRSDPTPVVATPSGAPEPAGAVPDDEAGLAPIEMFRPVSRRQGTPNVPSGLAQIIAFKPRRAAELAYL